MAYEKRPGTKNYHTDNRRTDGKPGDFRRTDGKSGDNRRTDGKSGDFRRTDGKPGDFRRTDGKSGDFRRTDGKPTDGKRTYTRAVAPGKGFDKRTLLGIQPDASATPAPPVQTETDELPYLIIGRNAVREAVKAGRSIDRILVIKEGDGSLREIVNLARDQKLVIREVDRKKLDELCMPFGHGGKTANHQGIVAYAAGVSYCDVKDILAVAAERNEKPFVIVLDGVEDPHNLGSIIRSADQAGAHGVIIGKRRSAQVSAAAVKASAGAVEYVKVARVVNVAAAIEELKRAGLWIAGADMAGESMYRQKLDGAMALVIGGEGEGLSKLVRDRCDLLVSIPMQGHLDSLNAAVAAAVLMFEKRRQDGDKA